MIRSQTSILYSEKGERHIYGHNTIRFDPMTIPEYLRDEIQILEISPIRRLRRAIDTNGSLITRENGSSTLPVCTQFRNQAARRWDN